MFRMNSWKLYRKYVRKVTDFGDVLEVSIFLFSRITWAGSARQSFLRKLLSFDARNDTKVGTEFIAVDHEGLTREEIGTDGFFNTRVSAQLGLNRSMPQITSKLFMGTGIRSMDEEWSFRVKVKPMDVSIKFSFPLLVVSMVNVSFTSEGLRLRRCLNE